MKATMTLITADTPNQYGTVIPREVLERAIVKYQESVGNGKALGETGDSFDSNINLKNVSHQINKLFWEENTLMAEIETLRTPMGFVLEDLLNAGCEPHLSYRGVGGWDSNKVVSDFSIISFDYYAQNISEMLPSDSKSGDYITHMKFDKVD